MTQNKNIHRAEIIWRESGEPYSEQFQDIYFSGTNGLAETEYVFLKHNHFPQRFLNNRFLNNQSLNNQSLNNRPLIIAETGFGTSLNFLVTAYHWRRHTSRVAETHSRPRSLQFISVEKYPLSRQQLEKVYQTFKQRWPCLSEVCDQLMAVYPADIYPPEVYLNQSHLVNIENSLVDLTLPGCLRLVILLGDATEQLKKLTSQYQHSIDAWYLDGFSPAKNNSMWTPALFSQIARLSHPGTTLSTFTAAGNVRRGLTKAGFKIKKASGFGRKREMLYGYFEK